MPVPVGIHASEKPHWNTGSVKRPNQNLLREWLETWSRFVCARAKFVVISYAVLTLISAYAAITHLSVDTDTSGMLSPDLQWRLAEEHFKAAFPDQDWRIIVVADAAHPEQAERSITSIQHAISDRPDLFKRSEAPFSSSFFKRNGLLYLSLEELESLSLELESAQALLGRLSRQTNLAGLFDLLSQAMKGHEQDVTDRLPEVLRSITQAIPPGETQTLSWRALLAKKSDNPPPPRLVLIQVANQDTENLAVEYLRNVIATLPEEQARSIALTGEAPLWVDQLNAARQGAMLSAVLALVLGATLLYAGLQSGHLVAACVISLMTGLVLTAGFASVTIGRLNMISVAFATLYIGIAIDYGVHLSLRYRELVFDGLEHSKALIEAASGIGPALSLCAFTSLAAFLAFIPTDYPGISELGWISGGGILIGLFLSLSLLPALIQLMRPQLQTGKTALLHPLLERLAKIPHQHPGKMISLSLLLCLLAIPLALQLQFDHNPMHLNPPESESMRAYDRLRHQSHSPMTVSAIAQDEQQLQQLTEGFSSLNVVGNVIRLEDWVPQAQTEKMELIEALKWSLALPEQTTQTKVEPERDRLAIQELLKASSMRFDKEEMRMAARDLHAKLSVYTQADAEQLTRLQQVLLGEFPATASAIREALEAQPFSRNDLPDNLARQWLNNAGQYRIEITAADLLEHDQTLIAFVDALNTVSNQISGSPVAFVGAARSVKSAFVQAFALAAILIFVLLIVVLRNVADTLRALAPLMLGTIILLACMVMLGIPMNFANVIALPLLLGMGVDIGLLMLWRSRLQSSAEENPLVSATGRAVLVCVLATLASFASLSVSADRGMSSIGVLLSLGLAIHLMTTILLLPALLTKVSTVTFRKS